MLGNSKREGGSARKAFRNSVLGFTALAIALRLALGTFNKSNIPGERIYDPVVGIMIAAIAIIAFFTIVYYHFTRTDEHDLIANLWACTMGFLTFGIMMPMWGILHDSGVLGPANPKAAFGIGLTVCCVAWAWHKFR